jgi:hypothetical protein
MNTKNFGTVKDFKDAIYSGMSDDCFSRVFDWFVEHDIVVADIYRIFKDHCDYDINTLVKSWILIYADIIKGSTNVLEGQSAILVYFVQRVKKVKREKLMNNFINPGDKSTEQLVQELLDVL